MMDGINIGIFTVEVRKEDGDEVTEDSTGVR